jgi:protein-tyrosine phosphatase
MKILMVCLGNICRSPLAEGILKHQVEDAGLDWQVDSAGTGAYHIGELPDPRSQEVAQVHGLDITDQRARQFKVSDFDTFDHILVMDSSNYQNVLKLARNAEDKAKVELIMNYAEPNMNTAVPDPYWDDNGFENVYQMLTRACKAFVEQHQ